mmetsp:Transcript_41275/g.128958  ORF Transcript_41275/g.128958 Transcript_41275/m.128958 type:complete len:381 (+) Transcript_41275:933-2075(+)
MCSRAMTARGSSATSPCTTTARANSLACPGCPTHRSWPSAGFPRDCFWVRLSALQARSARSSPRWSSAPRSCLWPMMCRPCRRMRPRPRPLLPVHCRRSTRSSCAGSHSSSSAAPGSTPCTGSGRSGPWPWTGCTPCWLLTACGSSSSPRVGYGPHVATADRCGCSSGSGSRSTNGTGSCPSSGTASSWRFWVAGAACRVAQLRRGAPQAPRPWTPLQRLRRRAGRRRTISLQQSQPRLQRRSCRRLRSPRPRTRSSSQGPGTTSSSTRWPGTALRLCTSSLSARRARRASRSCRTGTGSWRCTRVFPTATPSRSMSCWGLTPTATARTGPSATTRATRAPAARATVWSWCCASTRGGLAEWSGRTWASVLRRRRPRLRR